MPLQHYLLATAGHVDHGKSALVKALTGTDPDRLPEEKARGITIDLGFAHLDLAAFGPAPATYRLGIVDVPGHEDFVKNMVAGVGAIDLALLVVAADDGWMPQTEEHLQILTYLGIQRAVVALTKADLVAGQEASAVERVRERLRGSPLAQAPIVPTSILTGQGLDPLKAELLALLAATPPPRDFGKPRLPVDRVFTLRGIGTVATGTLNGGTFQRGQSVVIQPAGKASRLRSLQNFNLEVETSGPGTRTAVNLPDIQAGAEAPGLRRGDVITLPELGGASRTLDVALVRSARLAGDQGGSARPLKDGLRVQVHHGSAHFAAKVLLWDGGEVTPGQTALAQLRCETPVYVFAGDRFIVRDWPEQATLAGGVVLDPDADPRLWRSEAQRKFLEACGGTAKDARAMVGAHVARDRVARRGHLLPKSHLSAQEVNQAIDHWVQAGKAVALGEWVMDASWWRALLARAAQTIDLAHARHPERVGLPLNELRASLEADPTAARVFETLLAALCQAGFRQTGVALARQGHRPALPPQLQQAGAKVRAALTAKPLEPPARKELAADALSQQALRFLLESGEAVEVSAELVLAAEGYARAKELIRNHLQRHGKATVSDLRQVLGSTRRILVPLLEKLDKEGLTRREGDWRVLRS